MAAAFLRYEQHGRTAIATLDRPADRNAIGDHPDCMEIVAACERAGSDPNISCLILTGNGPAFSAGGNLKNMRDRVGIGRLDSPAATRANYRRGVQRVIRALYDLELPTIAAVNGHAIGLGCDLACICDIRIASEAARFASSFIDVGLIPGDGGAWLLQRAVGSSKAAQMMFTGETLDAQQALACGLVSQVVAPDQLLPAARALAERITAKPAQALRLAKRLFREAQSQRLSDVLELSAAYQALAHETADHAEALAAFFEKRKPSFQGK
jgi:enoyl-CoA hydratase/carnithine racemase